MARLQVKNDPSTWRQPEENPGFDAAAAEIANIDQQLFQINKAIQAARAADDLAKSRAIEKNQAHPLQMARRAWVSTLEAHRQLGEYVVQQNSLRDDSKTGVLSALAEFGRRLEKHLN